MEGKSIRPWSMLVSIAVICSFCTLTSCGSEADDFLFENPCIAADNDPTIDDLLAPGETAEWILEGSAVCENCISGKRNTAFVLSGAISVVNDGEIQSQEPGLDIIWYEAQSVGACVRFDTMETVEGITNRLKFDGTLANGEIEGEFRGSMSGGETCRVRSGSGMFSISIQ